MTTVTVRTRSGSVQGAEEQGVHAFKGIPYAAAPIGDLRFRPPVGPTSWDGVRDASSFGFVVAQQPMPGVFGELGTPQNPAGDECLNLNVWTPDPGNVALPVLVWIHGGAFYAGSGIDDVYNGSAFARDGVVVVSLNYRLGVQGFCYLEEQFPQLAGTGNLGMLDQIAALEWVQENVAAFGGDPARVTIAGESAGGMSVTTLLAMPKAKGLFQRAIPQSGAGHNGISATSAGMIAGHLLELVGVQPGDLEALADVTSERLLAAQMTLSDELTNTRDPGRFGDAAASAMAFQPTFGTELLPHRPIDAVAAGAAVGIPVLTGTTKEEALIFLVDLKDMFNDELVSATMGATFGAAGKDGAAALELYRSNRPDAQPHELIAAVETDRMFTVPAIRLADAQTRHDPDVWMYRFDWRTPSHGGDFGAHHFLEVPFVFDQLDNPQANGFLGGARPRDLAKAVHASWVAFATSGDPNNALVPEWPRYDPERRPTMLFDDTCRVELRPAADEIDLWEGVI
jgi:para-nitrobenzyl esterase